MTKKIETSKFKGTLSYRTQVVKSTYPVTTKEDVYKSIEYIVDNQLVTYELLLEILKELRSMNDKNE